MKEPNCYIVGAGARTKDKIAPSAGDLVIAADGGYRWLSDCGIQPDLLVGDLDSLSEIPTGVPLMRLPKEKDETDTAAAIQIGIERGCRCFHIYGGTGGRFDHTVANLQLLAWLSRRQCAGTLYGEGWHATAVTDGTLALGKEHGGMISVFAWGDAAEGVNLTGLKYPLRDATLTCDTPLGVSNEPTGGPACISVERGTLLVVQQE